MDSGAYYFVSADGRRGDIIRCLTYQPEIVNPEDYTFYMWAETLQGFFLLHQRFLEGRAEEWQLAGEFEFEDRGPGAFELLSQKVRAMLDSGEL